MKFLKNNIKCSKTLLFSAETRNAFLAWKMLKFGFLYFWKSCREFNVLSKNTNLKSIGILNKKLKPKFKQVQKKTQVQHHLQLPFKIQICSRLFKQIYLLPQFQKKANNLALILSHPFPYKERRHFSIFCTRFPLKSQ